MLPTLILTYDRNGKRENIIKNLVQVTARRPKIITLKENCDKNLTMVKCAPFGSFS